MGDLEPLVGQWLEPSSRRLLRWVLKAVLASSGAMAGAKFKETATLGFESCARMWGLIWNVGAVLKDFRWLC